MKRPFLPLLVATAAVLWTGSSQAQPAMEVHKSPTCGCCGKWIEHLEANGFTVEAHDSDAMAAIKEAAGVPRSQASCHTGQVDGYFIEGHVPAADVVRLLSEKPAGRGLTVPGMPVGSPGMEMGDRRDSYQVLLVKEDGSTEVFSQH